MFLPHFWPKNIRQVSQMLIFDLNRLHRRRKPWLSHLFTAFWTKKRSTGVANADFGLKSAPQASQTGTFSRFCSIVDQKRSTGGANADFGPKSAPQASQTVTFSCFYCIFNKKTLDRCRKCWFWNKSAPQASRTVTFCVFLLYFEPITARQVSQIVMLDQNPLDRRCKGWLFHVFSWKDANIR